MSCNRVQITPFRSRPARNAAASIAHADRENSVPDRIAVSGWKKPLYLSCASIFFAFGICGVILPGLPCTPFLLLTSYFLVRSSPGLNAKLLKSRVFGPILADWQIHGGIRPVVKTNSIIIVISVVLSSLVWSRYSIWASAAIVVLATIGIGVIWRLPTVQRS